MSDRRSGDDEGKSLRALLDSGAKFDLSSAVRTTLALLEALKRLHEAGIVHRNVHPGCVFLDAGGGVRLGGMELAKRMGDPGSGTGEMSGKIAVLAPEQVLGGTVDERTDLYHCGLILYRLVTGRRAFEATGAWGIAKKVVSEDPPAPAAVDPAIPRDLSDVILRALSRAPENRFATAAEFAERLAACQPRAG